MSIPRTVYFAQTAVITNLDTNVSYTLPVSTANIEVSRPIEAVSAFGKFGSLNTAQTNLTTCKSSLKMYLGAAGGGLDSVDGVFLQDLYDQTREGTAGFSVTVSPGGFSMQGIVSNIGLDIAMGGFGMCDVGFAGVGNPTVSGPSQNTNEVNENFSLSPITTMSIGGVPGGTAATSIKVAIDMPTDVLSALGDNPNASQGTMQSQIATKAPYKATVSVEGYGVDPSLGDGALTYEIGDVSVRLPKAKVSARSFNNAAGQVSATYSYTVEDSSVEFGGVSLNGYAPNGTQNLPAYGA